MFEKLKDEILETMERAIENDIKNAIDEKIGVCYHCGKTDFNANMIKIEERGLMSLVYRRYHESCYMTKNNIKKCICGKGYVSNGESEAK